MSRLACGLLAAVVLAVLPATARAERVVTYPGTPSPGTPKALDQVRVVQEGPASATHVLVFVPGTLAGAGYALPDARDLVRALPGWQVWVVDRRENLLEDHTLLDRAEAGTATGQQVFDYYLGWLGGARVPSHFTPRTDAETTYARRWGMRVAVEDLHRVIAAARRGGRKVVLGGHSLGGTITTAYATWDFDGRPGVKDLSGLVFVDGGSSPTTLTTASATQQKAAIDRGSPFLDLLGNGLPWTAGVFAAVGASLARHEPDDPSSAQSFSLLPADLKPPVPVTNAAQLGYALDASTSPPGLALAQSHIGHYAPSGDVRGWVDAGRAPIARVAQAVEGVEGIDGFAWYHPRRLSLDGAAVNGGVATAAQEVLGVRTTRGRDVHVPIYAIETMLGRGRVLKGARALARLGHVPRAATTFVDRSRADSHCDPLFDAPGQNAFLKTVEPFLRRIR